jgi:hypothetical protein
MKWDKDKDKDREAQDRQKAGFMFMLMFMLMFSYFCMTWDIEIQFRNIQTHSDSNSRLKWSLAQWEKWEKFHLERAPLIISSLAQAEPHPRILHLTSWIPKTSPNIPKPGRKMREECLPSCIAGCHKQTRQDLWVRVGAGWIGWIGWIGSEVKLSEVNVKCKKWRNRKAWQISGCQRQSRQDLWVFVSESRWGLKEDRCEVGWSWDYFFILGGYLWICGGYLMARPITDPGGIDGNGDWNWVESERKVNLGEVFVEVFRWSWGCNSRGQGVREWRWIPWFHRHSCTWESAPSKCCKDERRIISAHFSRSC